VARWYPLKPHEKQQALIDSTTRFNVVACGRRSGKSEIAKRFIAKKMMENPNAKYFIGGPTREQLRSVWWEDMQRLTMAKIFGERAINNSRLTITLPNGAMLALVSLSKPERIEGTDWWGGVVDECADIPEHAWDAHIFPALGTYNPTRPDYRAWCWLVGTPDGLNHFYDRAMEAQQPENTDWSFHTWKSAEIMPPEEVEKYKKIYSPMQFRQEFEAAFEDAGGKLYYDYGKDNWTTETIQPNEQLLWFHDFNFTPLSSGIGVIRGSDNLMILDEIVLESAVARQSAEEFVERFTEHKNRTILLYGDPAGRAGEKHGHQSDYTEMERVLRNNGWEVIRQVKAKAPAIIDRQNAVRAKICNASGARSLFVNPEKAKYCDKGLATVQTKEGSTFLEKDSDYQHITTAIGYCVDYIWPTRTDRKTHNANPEPTLNYY